MSILDLQHRLMEAGRIRIGQQVPTSGGKTRPAKLDTFRLTSRDRRRIDAAAELWGGEVAEWSSPNGQQWEVVTETTELDILVPPEQMAFSQHYELWSAGGCQRRCDGVTESITDQPCLCDPEERQCNIHTRLSVMLRDLPGLGVWRLDTSGFYAAVELAGAVEIMSLATGAGAVLPARLRLEQRSVKRPNEGVRRFAVPVLDIEVTPGELVSRPQALAAGEERRLLEPVPASLTAPVVPIREQIGQVREVQRRGRADIPATDIEPRTVAEVAEVVAAPSPGVLAQIVALLADEPKESETVPVWEAYLRELFALMHRAGLWGERALHASLAARDFAHVGDMRKAQLIDFTRTAAAKAREGDAVAAAVAMVEENGNA